MTESGRILAIHIRNREIAKKRLEDIQLEEKRKVREKQQFAGVYDKCGRMSLVELKTEISLALS